MRARAIRCALKYGLLPPRFYEAESHYAPMGYLQHLRLNLAYAWRWFKHRETLEDRRFERKVNPASDVDPIAASEDDALAWYPRSSSRRAAIADFREIYGGRRWTIKSKPEFMRPRDESDCKADSHWDDDEEGYPDDCRCYLIEEGYFHVCEGDHLAATAVWRIEHCGAPAWWYRLRRWLRARHPSQPGFRPVLWGGRLPRRANRLDRLIMGKGTINLPGDRWFRLGETELRWCRSCRHTTPHDIGRERRHFYCLAEGHGERWHAPMATDLRKAN